MATLLNLVSVFRRSRTSQLARAIALDEDIARDQLRKRRKLKEEPPDLTEVPLSVSLQMAEIELLQQIAHYTAGASWSKKKPKVKKLLRPVTAFMKMKKRHAREKFEELVSTINFVPDEEFRRQQADQATPARRKIQ